MTLRIAFFSTLLLALATTGQANEFIGDLVYCDDNANGIFDEGEQPIDGAVVNVTCWHVLDENSGAREACVDSSLPGWNDGSATVVTGQIHDSIVDGYGAFLADCGSEAGYDPRFASEREGRYIVRVPACTVPGQTDRIECEVDVDEAASAPALGACNIQVTPLAAGFPVDGNGDGDFCDATDGPFPEGQPLGNLPHPSGLTCNDLPDLPPGDGLYRPVIQFTGGDLCSLNNDFGYTGGNEPPECDLGVEKTCQVLAAQPQGDDCEGKVRRAVFEYTGESCDALDNTQEGKATCTGGLPGAVADVVVTKDADKIFATPNAVTLGGSFEIVKRDKGELKDFPSELKFDLRGDSTQSIVLHTSCSKPLAVGDHFGGVRLVELETTEGGITTLDLALDGGSSSCELPAAGARECEDKPLAIHLRYVGGECSVSNSQEGKASCDGVTADEDPVHLLFSDDDGKKVFHDAEVGLGDVAVVTNQEVDDDGDSGKFDSNSRVQLFDGNRLLQTIELHTSCSKPLRIGDRFGALEVVGLLDPKLGLLQDGADVRYQWTIENGGSDLTNVTLRDAQLDPADVPGTPLASLEAGATRVFEEVIRVDGPVSATEGAVVVEGLNAAGELCRDTATATITEAVAPAVPFVCKDAKPIDTLTLVWTGPSGVDVVSESGQRIDDVSNGQEIVLDVLDLGNDVDITVSGALSGQSRFHVSCSDEAMNGPEDCGTLQGNSKNDESGFLNLWSFQGMAGDLALECVVPQT